VYNDLALLRDAGIPVIRKRNGYRLADGFLMPPLGLTLDESAALLLQMALPSLVAARDRNLVAATEKLLAGLPPEIRAQTHLLRAHVYFTDGRSRVPPHTTGELLRSILERRRVAISGAPSGDGSGLSAAWSLLDPYGLIHHESSWYVTGYYEAQRQVVTLRVADIWRVEGTPLHFAIPPDFRITDHVPSVPAQGATSSRDSPSTRGSQRLHLPVAVTSP
jgi:predicted DNA-binding transcriptional regulator YafY